MALVPGTAAALEWSAGIGATAVRFPAYRGAAELETLALPLPTISVTADRWRIGRQGARLDLGGLDRVTLRLTGSGSLPVNSDDIDARQGMPDLDPSLELGPALVYNRILSDTLDFSAELLVRAVVAVDPADFQFIGLVAQPRMSLRWLPEPYELNVASGPLWASTRYHAYFYDVKPAFVTAERPAYVSEAGYSGWRSQLIGSVRQGRLGVHGFILLDTLSGAVFEDSPLVRRDDYLITGIFLTWRLAQGERY